MIDLFEETLRIAEILDQNGVEYALVGGLAYSIWVEPRNTVDIDILIKPDDWDKVKAALKPLDYLPRALPMDFEKIRIRRLTKLLDDDALMLDCLLADGDLIAGINNRVTFDVEGHPISVAPPEEIIKLKQQRMSDKDKNDIEGLLKVKKR